MKTCAMAGWPRRGSRAARLGEVVCEARRDQSARGHPPQAASRCFAPSLVVLVTWTAHWFFILFFLFLAAAPPPPCLHAW